MRIWSKLESEGSQEALAEPACGLGWKYGGTSFSTDLEHLECRSEANASDRAAYPSDRSQRDVLNSPRDWPLQCKNPPIAVKSDSHGSWFPAEANFRQ
jgi:hypothetical protein